MEKGKDKSMHMVQFLPLEASHKYLAILVSKNECVHECCVIASMCQPSFEPHDLLHLHGTIHGQRVRIIIDDGATCNFLYYNLVKNLHLHETPSSHSYIVSMMNVNNKDVCTQVNNVPLSMQGHTMLLNFQVMNMSRAYVVLGGEWLHELGSYLKRSYENNTIQFEANGIHVVGQRENEKIPL